MGDVCFAAPDKANASQYRSPPQRQHYSGRVKQQAVSSTERKIISAVAVNPYLWSEECALVGGGLVSMKYERERECLEAHRHCRCPTPL